MIPPLIPSGPPSQAQGQQLTNAYQQPNVGNASANTNAFGPGSSGHQERFGPPAPVVNVSSIAGSGTVLEIWDQGRDLYRQEANLLLMLANCHILLRNFLEKIQSPGFVTPTPASGLG